MHAAHSDRTPDHEGREGVAPPDVANKPGDVLADEIIRNKPRIKPLVDQSKEGRRLFVNPIRYQTQL
jgi:hypothetical protein